MASVTRPGGAELLGATVYELEPGARWAALHVHYANEELIVVLGGTPTLYTLAGSRELASGEVAAAGVAAAALTGSRTKPVRRRGS